MDHNRNQDQDSPNRASNMEPAEGSRETVGSDQSSDRGSSTDRAMFSDRESSEERSTGSSDAPGSATGGERHDSRNSGGITNRELDREMSEQQHLPERGHSQGER